MTNDPINVKMIGFERDEGLNDLFVQFGIAGDYKSVLPVHLTEILSKQHPGIVIASIELLEPPSCSLEGTEDESNKTLVRVQQMHVSLVLRTIVQSGEFRHSLDVELVLKCDRLDTEPSITTDMFVKGQTRLNQGS